MFRKRGSKRFYYIDVKIGLFMPSRLMEVDDILALAKNFQIHRVTAHFSRILSHDVCINLF